MTSDVTSTRTNTSRSLIITTNRTRSVTVRRRVQERVDTTLSQRVRLRRQAGLASQPGDIPDKESFGYNPTGYSDGEDEGDGGPPPRAPTPPVPAETTSTSTPVVVEAEAEAVVVEETKPKRRKAENTTRTRGRAKAKPLGRERSRPEV